VPQDKNKIDFINLKDGKSKEMNFTKEKVNHCVNEVDGLRILTQEAIYFVDKVNSEIQSLFQKENS
jgi:hypothetical protein